MRSATSSAARSATSSTSSAGTASASVPPSIVEIMPRASPVVIRVGQRADYLDSGELVRRHANAPDLAWRYVLVVQAAGRTQDARSVGGVHVRAQLQRQAPVGALGMRRDQRLGQRPVR